jgi:hypothetical protein
MPHPETTRVDFDRNEALDRHLNGQFDDLFARFVDDDVVDVEAAWRYPAREFQRGLASVCSYALSWYRGSMAAETSEWGGRSQWLRTAAPMRERVLRRVR